MNYCTYHVVTPTHVDPNHQVVRSPFRDSVVDRDVLHQQCPVIVPSSCHSVHHGLGTEEAKAGIVDLNLSASKGVELADFLAVGLDEVIEVLVC